MLKLTHYRIAAELYFSLGMQAAREMFGKSYGALASAEKIAVDNWVGGAVRANYQAMTLDFLTGQEAPKPQAQKQPVGFQTPPDPKAAN